MFESECRGDGMAMSSSRSRIAKYGMAIIAVASFSGAAGAQAQSASSGAAQPGTPAAPERITASPSARDLSIRPVPSQSGPTAVNGIPAQTVATNPEDARIDRLRQRGIVNVPSVEDTLPANIGGFRSTLADYGIGVGGILTGNFTGDLRNLPSRTNGTQRYVGQTSEFDSSNGYIGATYDLGRIGMTGGLFNFQACYNASTVGQFPHGMRVCAAYVDQPLWHHHFNVQVGILANNYQYANPFVGGAVSAGTLGPSANLITLLGLSVGGVGAPGVNISAAFGPFYSKFGVQRSTSLSGPVFEAQEANPYGLRFSEPGSGVVLIDELGYRVLAAPGIKQTWLRMAGVGNTSEYAYYPTHKSEKGQGAGMYFLIDHQFVQTDPKHPRSGLYAGGSYLSATPEAYTYDQYFEARLYDIGPFPGRPHDQFSLVANRTDASGPYLQYLRSLHDQTHRQIYNYTMSYTFQVFRGVYLNGGIVYAVDPAIITNKQQGNPVLFKLVGVIYL